ncbi:MAG: DUF805 domain-containing protein [Sphingomonadales bacterium]|nr:DUF805 domain-containing protein [Sphingomonadales bacterium]
MAQNWFHAARGRSEGPVPPSQILELIAKGTIGPQTLVWRSGLANWEAASAHFAFAPPPEARAAGNAAIGDGGPGDSAAPIAAAEPAPAAGAPRYLEPPRPESRDWVARARAAAPAAEGVALRLGEGPPPRDHTGPDGLYIGAPYRSFLEAIRVCLSKYLTFRGRASRSEYWWFYLFTILAGNILPLFGVMLGVVLGPGIVILFAILYLALLPPLLSVNVRRLHDVGRSGWWIGGPMIMFPAIGILAAIAGIAGSAAEDAGQLDGEMAGPLFAIMVGLAVLIGLAYGITMLVFSVKRGDPGPNRYG